MDRAGAITLALKLEEGDFTSADIIAAAQTIRALAAALTAPGEPIERRPAEGAWPEHCEQRAFVAGAAWWQFCRNGATAFPSERDDMEAEAVRRYGEPKR